MTGFSAMYELDEPELARAGAERETDSQPKKRPSQSEWILQLLHNDLEIRKDMREVIRTIRAQNEMILKLIRMQRSGNNLPVLGNLDGHGGTPIEWPH